MPREEKKRKDCLKRYIKQKKLIGVGDKRRTTRRLTAQDRERKGGKRARSGRRKREIFKAILIKYDFTVADNDCLYILFSISHEGFKFP